MPFSPANAIRSRRRDPDARFGVGLRVSHLLQTVDFGPPGMPPASTLIVRRFTDPMPCRLQPDAWALAPVMAWEQAAQASMAEIYRHAFRPAHGPVPLNATAVLFADQGELLACLACDLLRGAAQSLWWWRAILCSLPSSAIGALLAAWRRDARHIPAVLVHLARKGEAAWVLNAIPPVEARALLEDVTRAFEFNLSNVLPEQPEQSVSLGEESATAGQKQEIPSATNEPSNDFLPVPAPWRDLLPEHLVPRGLDLEQEALLGVSLVLQRTPHIARSHRFAQRFVAWRHFLRRNAEPRDASASPFPGTAAQHRGSEQLAQFQSSKPRAPMAPKEERSLNDALVALDSASADAGVSLDASGARLDGAGPKPCTTEALSSDAREISGQTLAHDDAAPKGMGALEAIQKRLLQPGIIDSRLFGGSFAASAQSVRTSEHEQAKQDEVSAMSFGLSEKTRLEAGEPVRTELGGLLFLINLLRALRLPGSLEEACQCDFGLGSWELLELLGRSLLGSRSANLAFDPVWMVLANLAGRAPHSSAAANFVPASIYRLPSAWLSTALDEPAGSIAVRLRGNHLQLWNTLGVPLLDCYCEQPPSCSAIREQVRELSPAAVPLPFSAVKNSTRRGSHPLGIVASKPLQRFLSFLLPYVRWRLALAFGLKKLPSTHLAKTLLLRPAVIWLTSSHIDMAMDLNQANGVVRLSGLDTDPGWVPELARVVKFHFRKMS